jgi:hypothetical protein
VVTPLGQYTPQIQESTTAAAVNGTQFSAQQFLDAFATSAYTKPVAKTNS